MQRIKQDSLERLIKETKYITVKMATMAVYSVRQKKLKI